jgi:periplasmic protein TonB
MSSPNLPPRLRCETLRALGPSFLSGGALLLVLPIAQIIDPVRPLDRPGLETTHLEPPLLDEVPEPPPDVPEDPPTLDEDKTPPVPPNPFILEVAHGVDVGRFAIAGPFLGFDSDELRDEVVKWADLTTHPQPLVRGEPVYPPDLRGARVEGDVRVKFLIRSDGSVGRVEIVSASHPRFAEAAERAVRRWRFQPGEKRGRPVAVWALQTIPFRIH